MVENFGKFDKEQPTFFNSNYKTEDLQRAILIKFDLNQSYLIPHALKEQFEEDAKWTQRHDNPVQMQKWNKYLVSSEDYEIFADFSKIE